MTLEAYINPDFGWPQKLIFLGAALAALIICLLFIIGGVKISVSSMRKSERKNEFYLRTHNRIQRFYEMIIAATSVMSFSCAYVIINHIYNMISTGERTTDSVILLTLTDAWSGGRDFILLLLICISCVLNTLLDRLIIPLKRLSKEERACVRMLAMFYAIFVLVYLNWIGEESEYSPVMIYYLGLMVGRFVYFDASFMDFVAALKNMLKNIYLLILCITAMGILCYVGFTKGYLLEKNYYIVGAFYTHLFMLVAAFIVHHSHIIHLFVRKPKDCLEPWEEDEEDDDDYDDYAESEYDDYEDGYEYDEDASEYADYED